MNVFTNEGYLADQIRRARRLQVAGLVSLAIVFLISCPVSLGMNLNPLIIILSYPFIFFGLPLWTIGSNRLKLLRRTPRDDQLITAELKGLSNKYSLHHYVPVGGKVIKHLLVAPAGLVVMESRDTTGPVYCEQGASGDRWKMRYTFFDRLLGTKLPVGNPSKDLDAATERAKTLLMEIGKPNVPVRGLVVFTRQQDLEIDSCSYPAVPLDETKVGIRDLLSIGNGGREEGLPLDQMLTSEDRRKINSRLTPAKAPVPARAASAQR